MNLIPEEELFKQKSLNLAPMVDFLFLILAIFACLALTRTALYDSEIHLVKKDVDHPSSLQRSFPASSTVLLSINEAGQYKWVTEFHEFLLNDVESIKKELVKQQAMGFLSHENTKVLLHIDQNAKWHSIAEVIFAVRDAGFQISPVYAPEKSF